eukprot:g11975.t1
MASIANQNNNVHKMDIRGVKIHVLQDISKRLNDFNSAERVFYKGNSAIKLADNILQIRKLNSNKQIVRENITLNEQEQLLIKPNMKAAIGDRVKDVKKNQVYAVTNVTENNEYTLTPIKTPEKFNHEANFAHWDWDITNNIIATTSSLQLCKLQVSYMCNVNDSIKKHQKAIKKHQKVVAEDVSGPFTCSTTGYFPTWRLDNISLTSGKWYYEIEVIGDVSGSCPQFGWADEAFTSNGQDNGIGDCKHSWGVDGDRKLKWWNGDSAYGKEWKDGDRIGFAIDIENKTIGFYVNNEYQGDAFTNYIVQSLSERVDPQNDYIWFDICTVNQHVWKNVDFQTTFKDAVGDIGHTMLILAPWKNPIPLRRSWCLWEINSTIETESKLEVVLPKSQEDDFIDTLLNDYEEIMKNLCNIDTRNSKAGNENDEEKIKLA